MRINPEYSIEHRRRILPFNKLEDLYHGLHGQRKANLVS